MPKTTRITLYFKVHVACFQPLIVGKIARFGNCEMYRPSTTRCRRANRLAVRSRQRIACFRGSWSDRQIAVAN